MKTDPDKFLNQLVVTALTVFITMILLFAVLIARQLWLQQRITELSSDVQYSLQDLEETTEELQRELSEMRASPEVEGNVDNWEEIAEVLDDVDRQLGTVEEDLAEVTLVLESEAATASSEDEALLTPEQDQIDQLFTIFATVIAIASIVIALLLVLALNVLNRFQKR